jgi:hypothetical protein
VFSELGPLEVCMPERDDVPYFARRAREEREKAENASNPVFYKAHIELARQYERRLVQMGDIKPVNFVRE